MLILVKTSKVLRAILLDLKKILLWYLHILFILVLFWSYFLRYFNLFFSTKNSGSSIY